MSEKISNANKAPVKRTAKSLVSKKISNVFHYRRTNKNIKRKFRRKRSKIKYYETLRELRIKRKTDDLCSAVSVVDIQDMEWSVADQQQSIYSVELPPDVAEWQKQEQIAYWKSRAISLELENRMLHEHIRNVYARLTEEYSESLRNQMESESANLMKKSIKKSNNETENKADKVLPNLPQVNERTEEMRKIYGDKAAQIMGMETAVQLNYERHVEESNPVYWPNIPINL